MWLFLSWTEGKNFTQWTSNCDHVLRCKKQQKKHNTSNACVVSSQSHGSPIDLLTQNSNHEHSKLVDVPFDVRKCHQSRSRWVVNRWNFNFEWSMKACSVRAWEIILAILENDSSYFTCWYELTRSRWAVLPMNQNTSEESRDKHRYWSHYHYLQRHSHLAAPLLELVCAGWDQPCLKECVVCLCGVDCVSSLIFFSWNVSLTDPIYLLFT